METVNRVVESASKALWGEQNDSTTSSAATASNSQNQGMTGFESVDRVVNAGKKALWGDQSSTPHGEEPVAGKRGLGTATDPYDAGNRDEQVGAPSVEEGGLPTNPPATEQRNVGTTSSTMNNMPSSSGMAATSELKTTATGLRPDPSQPGNATDSTSRVVADAGPGQTLKHTSEPLERETQKLTNDLKSVDTKSPSAASAAATTTTPAAAGGAVSSSPNTTKHVKNNSLSSTSTGSSGSSNSRGDQGQKSKTSRLEKVKNKLHIGNHSPKASR